MLARLLMTFCVVGGFLFLSEDARGYELLSQTGTASSTKVSPQPGLAGLTLSRKAMPKVGDSFRLLNERNVLHFGVLEEGGWDVGAEGMGETVQPGAGFEQQKISLIPRLLIGAGVTLVASLVLVGVIVPVLSATFDAAFFGGFIAAQVLFLGGLVLTPVALVLGVSWAVWLVGNALGGKGSYRETVGGMVLANLAAWGLLFLIGPVFGSAAMLLFLPLAIASLFGPVAGYEISSHKRRQGQSYSVGLSPVFAPDPASAPMRVEGATLAIRRSF